MRKTLRELSPGEKGTVVQVLGTGAVKRRIVDMGVTPGVEVFIRKIAPMGDPIEINLRSYELSIRKADAANIIIDY